VTPKNRKGKKNYPQYDLDEQNKIDFHKQIKKKVDSSHHLDKHQANRNVKKPKGDKLNKLEIHIQNNQKKAEQKTENK